MRHLTILVFWLRSLASMSSSWLCSSSLALINCSEISSPTTVVAALGPGGSFLASPNFFHSLRLATDFDTCLRSTL
uniref:Putative secreted protein n=1 Tax=Ixodes ricinus TaxID=34613 RepID=A0A6B0TZK5_IXORI